MVTEQSRELMDQFVADRRHWKVYERGDQVYAGRMFKYRTGAQVILSLRPVGGTKSRTWWVAQVNIAFSAGPEDDMAGPLERCMDWIQLTERKLILPFTLDDCRSQESATDMVALWGTDAIRLLRAVMEIESFDRQVIRSRLVQMFGPYGSRGAVAGRG